MRSVRDPGTCSGQHRWNTGPLSLFINSPALQQRGRPRARPARALTARSQPAATPTPVEAATLRYARRYYAHDATLRYAHAVATCGAAAALQLGAFGHSVCSSSPPGAVAVDACCAFHAAHRALRALSLMHFRARPPSRSILRYPKRPAAAPTRGAPKQQGEASQLTGEV